MKKHFLSLLALLLALCTLCACTSGGADTTAGGTTPNVTSAPGTKAPDTTTGQTNPGSSSVSGDPVLNRTPYTLEEGWDVLGFGIGVKPGRVVFAQDRDAFTWDGTGYWYLQRNFNEQAIEDMLRNSITALAGTDKLKNAFDAIFGEFNQRVYGADRTYTPGEKIAIKVNMNVTGNGSSSNTNIAGYYPSPATIRSLLRLLVEFGVQPSDITVLDPSRTMPTYLVQYCTEGELAGVKFVGYAPGSSTDAVADTTRPITWSYDLEGDNWPTYNGYPTVNESYYPTCVTEADYVINLSCLRGHTLAGFTASGKNHFGTVMPGYTDRNGKITFPEWFRRNPPSYVGSHHYVAANDYFGTPAELWHLPKREMGSYNILVDLLSNADCGGKTVLYLCDALATTVHQGSSLTLNEKWYTFARDGESKSWPCAMLVSQDPIALDSVALDFLLAEKEAAQEQGDRTWDICLPDGNTAENYLIEGALAYNPPSGTYYQDGYGNLIGSLGVHEHWNNPRARQYSRNLGKSEGIELCTLGD